MRGHNTGAGPSDVARLHADMTPSGRDDKTGEARTVVVTGSPDRVEAVSAALRRRGCEVVPVHDRDALVDECASLGPGSVDAYVQLPVDVPSSGDSVIVRLQRFLAGGLLARFDAVSAVIGTLRPNASVVFVAGNLPTELTAPDDRRARIALLRVLAQAVTADCAPSPVRTVVLEHTHSPDEIAAIAVDPSTRPRVLVDAAERYPEMSYVDWRLEVLSLASVES